MPGDSLGLSLVQSVRKCYEVGLLSDHMSVCCVSALCRLTFPDIPSLVTAGALQLRF